ncbi:sulfotransferase family 2 domain-containing protein [Salipiger abyssi]|uniref:sulfotransferase family 2 domain-containing protein n=1 Tax=Salipiger abyssi TaxID=1250539 RepID=UPI001A8C4945|nr:sulfotransferase family 2 domain-containing protein [Salipiger abyssi]MBN9889805.1 sulfotransferase family 2 domain-containing protein [Salipiger abyssi]
MKTYPEAFGAPEAAQRFVQNVWFPPSRAWRYQLNGKSGNTFVLNLLFELEYGTPFTCQVGQAETGNQHPDFALFQVLASGLWGNAFTAGGTLSDVVKFPGLSLATVRDPYARALSGFFYLCRSHALGDRRFLTERIRMNALAGMDWERDANTPQGFSRFLHYLRDSAEAFGAEDLDPHWMPQALHIRPEIYRPDLIGRTEDLAPFAKRVADRLDRPLPARMEGLRRNASSRPKDGPDFYAEPGLRGLVETLYARDFDLFDYSRHGG